MKWLHITDGRLSLEGLAVADREKERYWRLPEALIDCVNPGVANMARCPSGARVRFATDSRQVRVRMRVAPGGYIKNVGAIGKCGAAGCVDGCCRYLVFPTDTEAAEAEGGWESDGALHQHTIYLPLFTQLFDMEIGLDDECRILPPAPYRVEKPIVFYGSSITNGASATQAGNAYAALVARRLNANWINLGFSGSALGEQCMAEYIAGLDMSLFVLDYDHNAPDAEHLKRTHAAFFRTIREKHPELPVVMLSKPDYDTDPEGNAARRAVIRGTFEQAKRDGDRNVWFIDGETLFGKEERFDCMVDALHPNDLGFHRMADVITPVLKKALHII